MVNTHRQDSGAWPLPERFGVGGWVCFRFDRDGGPFDNRLATASGVVTAVEAEVGAVLGAGAPVLRLALDGARDAVFSVPEDMAAGIRGLVGQAGALQIRAWGSQQSLPATVREVAAAADPVTRTFQVKADLGTMFYWGVGLHKISLGSLIIALRKSVGEFVKVLIEAVLIVLAVSFIALGLHTRPLRIDIWLGMVVGITIPLVLAITAVEMMVRKLEEGYDKVRAATFAYEITAMPMLTGTLITAAGFLPIGLAQSVTGEYTFAIFAVTSAALISCWVVSVFFVPYLGTLLLRTRPHPAGLAGPTGPGGVDNSPHELFDTPFYSRFRVTVNWCVQHRWITIGLTVVSFALGIVGMGKVQQQFFPPKKKGA